MFRFYIQPELGEVLSILFSLRLASLCFALLRFASLLFYFRSLDLLPQSLM